MVKLVTRSMLLIVIITLSVVGSACALPAKPAPAAATPPSVANLVITPNSAAAGAAIVIRGSGFVPGEVVQLRLEMAGVSQILGAAQSILKANDYGAFRVDSFVPAAPVSAPGVYSVSASGNKGSSVASPLEVVKPSK